MREEEDDLEETHSHTGGELLLWGQIPCASRVSYHAGLKRLWTPQPVLLAGRKVSDVACGAWHLMALATWSREKNRHCARPETEAHFRDLVSKPLPTKHTEKENTVQDSRHGEHEALPGLERNESCEEKQTLEETQGAEKEERCVGNPHKHEATEELHEAAFTRGRSAPGTDRPRNARSLVESDPGDHRGEGCGTAESWEPRSRLCRGTPHNLRVAFTTLHLLPRLQGEQSGSTSSTFPQILTGRPAQSRSLTQAQKARSEFLAELIRKSGSDGRTLHNCSLGPKPRPPERCTSPGGQKAASCHLSRMRLQSGLRSPLYHSSPNLSSARQDQMSSLSSPPGSPLQASLLPAPASSKY